MKTETELLYNKTRSITKVGAILGLTRSAVSRRLHKLGVKLYGPHTKENLLLAKLNCSLRSKEKNNFWKGGVSQSYYQRLLKPKKCLRCGSKENLVIHHVDRNRRNNELTNLFVLCKSCHSLEHRKLTKL